MSRKKKKQSAPMSAQNRILAIVCAVLLVALAVTGIMDLIPTLRAQSYDDVRILRVMTDNTNTCLPIDGQYYDWLEIVNLSDEDIDLTGWKLTDELDIREAYVFPETILRSGDSMIIYAAVCPEGQADSGKLFCGFNLSSDGVDLALTNEKNEGRATLNVPAIPAGKVYALNTDTNEYEIRSAFDYLGVGLDMSKTLRPDFDANNICINEAMARNKTTIQDENGDYSDWIELYNPTDAAISLAGWSLSNNETDCKKWTFPDDYTLAAGEYKVLFMNTVFALSKNGERVTLFDESGTAVSYIEYASMSADESYYVTSNGSVTNTFSPTPGVSNSHVTDEPKLEDDYYKATENDLGLYLNEVLVSAEGTPDWVELYNASSSTIDLSDYRLTDDTHSPRKWIFPTGTTIGAGQYLLVFLCGEDTTWSQSGTLCADFALRVSEEERLILYSADGAPVDRMVLKNQRRGISYGRMTGSDDYRYFTSPTPMADNGEEGYLYCAADVTFSVPGGKISEDSIRLELSSNEGMKIYYTTDGSDPTKDSNVYDEPIKLKKSTVVKAIAWRKDGIASDIAVNTYIFGAAHTVPIISVSGDYSELIGSNGTFNTGDVLGGQDVYVEIYNTDDEKVISQACLLKLNGASSRYNFDQKAFRLMAKKSYGSGKFKYALFSNRDYTEYDTLLVRASGQDAQKSFMRDVVLTSLARNTDVYYQESETCVVYINGQYWGVYHLRERCDAQSICQFEGWTNPDNVDMLKNGNTVQGDTSTFFEIRTFAKSHSAASEENLAYFEQYIDVENYLQYVALEMYTLNQDLGNVRMYRNAVEGDGKWRFVFYDLDLGFNVSSGGVSGWLTGDTVGSITQQDSSIFQALIKNDKMLDYFLTFIGEMLATDWSAEAVESRIKEEHDILLPEMPWECKRWDWSQDKWEEECEELIDRARARPTDLMKSLIKAFDLTDEQATYYFGKALEVHEAYKAKVNG